MQQKTTWTRYLTLGISLITLGFVSCARDEHTITSGTYIYVNNLKSVVLLETYTTGYNNPKIIQMRKIESGDSLISKSVGEGAFPFSSGFGSGADSAILRFSDEKCTSYINLGTHPRQQARAGSIFNLKEYDNYSEELVNRRAYTLRYTIDSTDYKKSRSCQ